MHKRERETNLLKLKTTELETTHTDNQKDWILRSAAYQTSDRGSWQRNMEMKTSGTSLGVSYSIIKINHGASDVQHATDLQTKRDKQKRTGNFLVTWYTSFVKKRSYSNRPVLWMNCKVRLRIVLLRSSENFSSPYSKS